jgi:hypothetical protein
MKREELTQLATANGVETKAADEAAEAGVVEAARDLIASRPNATPEEIFDHLQKMYENQPNLTAKTATSKIAQAYSTPIPMAYLASRLADVKGGKKIYGATAGNGALLIESDPNKQRFTPTNSIQSARPS